MVPGEQKGGVQASPLVFWDNYGFKSKHSGIDRYANCLAQGLRQHGVAPVFLRYHSTPQINSISVGPNNWFERQFLKAKLAWPNLSFTKLLKHQKSLESLSKKAVFHGLANSNLPFALPKKRNFSYVLTVHDLIPLFSDSGVSTSYKLQFSYMLPKSLEYSDLVICVSQWTLDQLLERYPLAKDKTVLVPHGMNLQQKSEVHKALETDSKQLLFVSRWEPYKGFQLIHKLLGKLPPVYKMIVVTDNKGEQYLNQHAASHMLANRLFVLHSIDDAKLQQLYEVSNLYVHFSRYEGFGLPIREALLQGTPVLFFKGHACDDLGHSKVALGMDQNCSVDDWVDAIEAWSSSKSSPHFHGHLSEYLDSQPTWSDTAEKVKALYNSII
ncbi:MAG: glycosyltransferase [Oligoflexales bacterium]|nr:glycosyltransferase [Oligoflexales bacterium]